MSEQAPIILVVGDDAPRRQLLGGLVASLGFRLQEAASGEEAVARIRENPPDVMLLDAHMPGMRGGIETLAEIRKMDERLPVLWIAAEADAPPAAAAMKGGADDYLAKPVDLDELDAAITDALGGAGGALAVQRRLAPELPAEMICQSPAMRHVVATAAAVAPSGAAVLITGASGVGKKVVARLIHRFSPRAAGPWVAVDCADLQESRVEGDLFGRAKGAMAGAVEARQGLFQAADGGTLFLDQIDQMPLDVQPKLLRALESCQIVPVGSDNPIAVNTRVVAATKEDLRKAVEAGRFCSDLYDRINVVDLFVPPLRERHEDILPLARRFASEYAGTPVRLSPQAMKCLLLYPLPGNARELRKAVERACLLCLGDVIVPEHLPPKIASPDANLASAGGPLSPAEIARIQAALAECHGNRSQAAKKLGISRRALICKLRAMKSKW